MKLKYLLIAIFMASVSSQLFSQDEAVKDSTWKFGGTFSLNLNQAYYENWTAGGVPSVAGVSYFKTFATYTKKKWKWDNQLDVAYGLINEREKKMRKTDDKIHFDTKLGYELKGPWYVSLLATFKSQFTPGFEDPEIQEIKISDWMAPAYVMTSLGFDYTPNDNFQMFIAPIAAKATIVLDQLLADQGAYGVEPGFYERDQAGDTTFTQGERYRIEYGAHFKAQYKKSIWTNVDFATKLELYTNYFENFGNIDVNWDFGLEMKVNDFLSANFRVETIYDDDIMISTGTDDEGVETFGPRMQLKQLFGMGLTYKF